MKTTTTTKKNGKRIMRELGGLVAAVLLVWLLVLAVAAQKVGASASASGPIASGGTDCAMAATTGDDHIAVDWPLGQQDPQNTFAGDAPAEDLIGVLSCGDGRYVNYQWLAGASKAAFQWGP